MNATSKVSGTLGKGLAALSMDDAFVRRVSTSLFVLLIAMAPHFRRSFAGSALTTAT